MEGNKYTKEAQDQNLFTKPNRMNNFLITMSGGTTQVINATLVGAIQTVRKRFPQSKIYAGYPGITGLLSDDLIDLTNLSCDDLSRVYRTPASGLIGTTRVKPIGEAEIERMAEVFRARKIKYYLNIGGSGTIKQTMRIGELMGDELIVCALPKTVDNDFGDRNFSDVLFTPGFPSCANYWRHKTHIFNLENLGAFSHDKVLIGQTFGRKTGFLAACARLADRQREFPLVLLLPEDQRPLEDVLGHIEHNLNLRNRCMVIMSEGYDIGECEERLDPSGQVMYSSSENTAAQMLVNASMKAGMSARAFVSGFDQRSDMKYVSTIDLESAFGVAEYAVKAIQAGEDKFFASVCRLEGALNRIGFKTIPFDEIGDYGRTLPKDWIDWGNFDVTDQFVQYAEPLIGIGELAIPNQAYDNYFASAPSIFGKKPEDLL